MNDLERRVLEELQRTARGRDRAVSAKVLARRLGAPERAIRQAVSDLRNAGALIASAVEPPAGFYVPATREEADVCSRHLWARVRKIAQVARAFDRAALPLGLDRPRFEQIRLVFEDEEAIG